MRAASPASNLTRRRPIAALGALAIVAGLAVATPQSATAADADGSLSGELLEVVIDNHEAQDHASPHVDPSTTEHLVRTRSGELIPIELPASLDGVEPGARIEATTRAAAHGEAVPVIEADVYDAPQAAVTASAHTAYVVRIDDATTTTDISQAAADTMTAQAGAYWVRESRGAITSFSTAASAVLRLDNSCTADYATLWQQAGALFAGVTFSSSKHLIVYSPLSCEATYPYAGIATVGANANSGGRVHIVSDRYATLVHELGHNLSLRHSNLQVPGAAKYEYWGIYGPMGIILGDYGPGVLDAAQQAVLDLPNVPHNQRTQAWNSAASYVLSPLSSNSGTTAVRFTDPTDGGTYFLQYRSGTGADANTYYADANSGWWFSIEGTDLRYPAGVQITRLDGAAIDTYPLMSGSAAYGAIRPGQTFTSPSGSFQVSVTSMDANAAAVTVALGAPRVTPTVSLDAPTTIAHGTQGTFTATVTVGSAPATGPVSFWVDGNYAGSATLAAGKATWKSSATVAPGPHTVTARFNATTSTELATKSVKVNVLASTATISNAPASIPLGTSKAITATVTSSATKPTGTVTFYVDGTNRAKVALVNGVATWTLPSNLTAGTHWVTPLYSGSTSAQTSKVTTRLDVQAPTTTTSNAPGSVALGASQAITATVRGGATPPTGTVTFYVDGVNRGKATLVNGAATWSLPSNLAPGSHWVTPLYGGSAAAQSSKVTTKVNVLAPSAVSWAAPTSIKRGTARAVTITVSSATGTPTGVVDFYLDSVKAGTASVVNGRATFTIPASLATGTHRLTPRYTGSATHSWSDKSLTFPVVP